MLLLFRYLLHIDFNFNPSHPRTLLRSPDVNLKGSAHAADPQQAPPEDEFADLILCCGRQESLAGSKEAFKSYPGGLLEDLGPLGAMRAPFGQPFGAPQIAP